MKTVFWCSLCHNGILGGGLYLDENAVTYRTGKVTVDEKYKNFVIPLTEIKEIVWKWRVFPVATFVTRDSQKTTFLIFNKRRFVKYFAEVTKPL